MRSETTSGPGPAPAASSGRACPSPPGSRRCACPSCRSAAPPVSDALDLLELAHRVVGAARSGEEVEAYVVRSRETDVRVFDGEVESLSMAGVEGVGVRVISDHRQGFAWAGSLEPAVVDETLEAAIDNAAFRQPDAWHGLPTPA